ncbi:MAG: DUF3616 domain-containing protein [Pseudomonadota bacterium]
MKLLIPAVFAWLSVTGFLYAQTIERESFPRHEKFRKSEGIYEPSGVVQLLDGRMVIAEDEASHPLSIMSLDADGTVQVVPLKGESFLSSLARRGGLRILGKLDDLEGLSMDKDGYVYAVTSYSRTEHKGRVSRSREKLIRFRVQGDRITDSGLVPDLKKFLTAHHPVLDKAASAKGAKRIGGLEIEGLTFNKGGDQLWFGFRSPLIDNKTIILALENPSGVFNHEAPRFREIYLDLNGAGIRGMTYDPRLKGYLILAHREDKKDKPFKLWFWSGDESDDVRKVKVAGVESLRRAEAVTPIMLGNREGILIFSDEGDHRRRKQGRYILLRYDQLSIDP